MSSFRLEFAFALHAKERGTLLCIAFHQRARGRGMELGVEQNIILQYVAFVHLARQRERFKGSFIYIGKWFYACHMFFTASLQNFTHACA